METECPYCGKSLPEEPIYSEWVDKNFCCEKCKDHYCDDEWQLTAMYGNA